MLQQPRSASFLEVSEPRVSAETFPPSPYACLVIINDEALGDALRDSLAAALVASRCRWVSFWGPGADAHQDSVDWTNVHATLELPKDECFVVATTAHEDESIGEVANMLAHLPGDEYTTWIVLGIGPSAQVFEEVRSAFEVVRRIYR